MSVMMMLSYRVHSISLQHPQTGQQGLMEHDDHRLELVSERTMTGIQVPWCLW